MTHIPRSGLGPAGHKGTFDVRASSTGLASPERPRLNTALIALAKGHHPDRLITPGHAQIFSKTRQRTGDRVRPKKRKDQYNKAPKGGLDNSGDKQNKRQFLLQTAQRRDILKITHSQPLVKQQKQNHAKDEKIITQGLKTLRQTTMYIGGSRKAAFF